MSSSAREIADNTALLIDLYQLTMSASYFAEGMFAPATFSFYIRRYAPERGYYVAAGLESVLRFLESFQFSAEALRHLRRTGLYRGDFLDYLEGLRFSGEVWAMAEGTPCFVPEPLVEVTAPMIEAQLVETCLINQLSLQTLIATKASRCFHAAQGRGLFDFSLRRTQGMDAGLKVARCSYLAGFQGTSNVLAEKRYGIPAFGTMAHSYVESFGDEIEAFRAFVRAFPDNSTLLVDTYDTLAGVRKAAVVGNEMAARGRQLRGVRLDSGDLVELSRGARRILDDAGLRDAKVFASGGLNEYKIADLIARGAKIDAFGVGTDMGVSADAPWLDCAYKLVEYAGKPRLKLSAGKQTLIGRKQVWRIADPRGRLVEDVLGLRGESAAAIAAERDIAPERVQPCLQQVMAGGKVLGPLPSLGQIRERFLGEFVRVPEKSKALQRPAEVPVHLSGRLQREHAAAVGAVRERVLRHTPRP
jgi:nicotinate phosphoribosyltransferase